MGDKRKRVKGRTRGGIECEAILGVFLVGEIVFLKLFQHAGGGFRLRVTEDMNLLIIGLTPFLFDVNPAFTQQAQKIAASVIKARRTGHVWQGRRRLSGHNGVKEVGITIAHGVNG
ncbi:hypothetical protein VINE108274_24055 [Vibrio neptunius]